MIISITLLILSVYPLQQLDKMTRVIPFQDETSLEVAVEFTAGKMVVGKAEPNILFDGTFYYDRYEAEIDYDVQNKKGFLVLEMSSIDREEAITTLDEIGDTEWFLNFGDQVPLDLSFEMGAIEARLKLGGLRLNSLDLESGTSDIRLDFNEVNLIPMKMLRIETGFGEFDAINLLNARFTKMRFDGSVGDYELHFGGTLTERIDVRIDVSVGSLFLVVPEEVPFRLACDQSIFSSLEVESAIEEEDDIWYSANYNRNKPFISFEIDAGIGSVSLRLID